MTVDSCAGSNRGWKERSVTNAIAERHAWTLDLLNVQPDDVLLEIGCGHGVVASLIAARLRSGRIVAIDRSAKMIEMAVRRNDVYVRTGMAAFETADIENFQPGGRVFDKVFAVNVSLFWNQPKSALGNIGALLAPEGQLYVIHHPPSPGKATESAEIMTELFPRQGFRIRDTRYQTLAGIPAVCVTSTYESPVNLQERGRQHGAHRDSG